MIPSLVNESVARPWLLVPKNATKYGFLWHCHGECEVMASTTGNGQAIVGDWHGAFAPGDVFVLPPMLPHSFFTPNIGSARRHHIFVLFFDLASELIKSLDAQAKISQVSTRWPGGALLKGGAASGVIALMRRAQAQDGLMATAAFLEILEILRTTRAATTLSHPSRTTPSPRRDAAARVSIIGQYLQTHIAQEVDLRMVAAAADISPAGACRLFRKQTGKTIFAYLQELRINYICRQLTETDEPIIDIAMNGGFATLAHFHRVFRKLKNLSPRQYRHQTRSASPADPNQWIRQARKRS
jgi:AraC-like DNA-binding protein